MRTICGLCNEDKFYKIPQIEMPFFKLYQLTGFCWCCCCCSESLCTAADVEKLHISHVNEKVSAPTKSKVRRKSCFLFVHYVAKLQLY